MSLKIASLLRQVKKRGKHSEKSAKVATLVMPEIPDCVLRDVQVDTPVAGTAVQTTGSNQRAHCDLTRRGMDISHLKTMFHPSFSTFSQTQRD